MIFARVLHALVKLLFLACFGTLCEEERKPLMTGLKCPGFEGKVVKTLLVLVPNPGLSGDEGFVLSRLFLAACVACLGRQQPGAVRPFEGILSHFTRAVAIRRFLQTTWHMC